MLYIPAGKMYCEVEESEAQSTRDSANQKIYSGKIK